MHGFFYGWYLKCQSGTQTLAVIPAVHGTGRKRTCSIQIINDNNTYAVSFPAESFHMTKENIYIGKNRFGRRGIRLVIDTPDLNLRGA